MAFSGVKQKILRKRAALEGRLFKNKQNKSCYTYPLHFLMTKTDTRHLLLFSDCLYSV